MAELSVKIDNINHNEILNTSFPVNSRESDPPKITKYFELVNILPTNLELIFVEHFPQKLHNILSFQIYMECLLW